MAGILLLAWIVWPKGTIAVFLVPDLWQLGACMILALLMGAASTRWLGSARSVGEGIRQMGEALHAIFALVLVWSLPPSLIGALGVILLLPLLLSDSTRWKQNTPFPSPPSLPLSQWRRDWWLVYLAGRRQLGVLLLAAGVSLLLDVVIGTILTPIGAETSLDHTLGLLWYGIEGQLVAVLLGAYLVSVNREVFGPDKPLIPEAPGPLRFLLASALAMIAASMLAFSDHRIFTVWALPFILGNFTLGTLLWSRLLPRLCPPLSAELQRLSSRSVADQAFWTTVDAQARKRIERTTGLLKVICVPAVGWGIEQWGLSTIFLVTGGTLIGLILLATGGWAMAGRRQQEKLREELFKKRGVSMQNQPDSADTSTDQGSESRWGSLLWYIPMLATGTLLWWSGGGVPPPVWRQVVHLLSEHATSRPQFPLLLAQAAFLLAAWGGLLLLTMRVTVRFLLLRTAPPSQRPSIEQNPHMQLARPEAIDTQEMASEHTRPTIVDVTRPPQVTKVGKPSPLHEDHAPDSSPLVQAANVHQPSIVLPFQPALFGPPLQLTVGSCSVDSVQDTSSTTAYLLIDRGRENASFSWPVGLFALVDHIPRDEPGHTRCCQAIETMHTTVIQACAGPQSLSDDSLATLVAEQAQDVVSAIEQQSQDEEVKVAISAVLIVGSQLYLANFGDTRIYLCCSQGGLYQVTDFPGGAPLLASHDHATSYHGSLHAKGKPHGRRRGISGSRQDHGLAMPLAPGDSVLLCSDGLWAVLHAAYLEHLIRSVGPDPTAMCSALLHTVRTSRSTDAVHMIIVHCQQS